MTGGAQAQTNPEAEAAVADYREYLEQNADEMVATTAPFVAAVEAGEVEKAKALYPVARIPTSGSSRWPSPSTTSTHASTPVKTTFEDVYASLKPYRRGDGFVSYTELTKADTRKLAQETTLSPKSCHRYPPRSSADTHSLVWMTVATGNRADQLLEALGFESWRPGQREAVEAGLEGRDSLIVMPTGGGKSLCYQLPGLATEDLTIVVSPLIALMQDQWRRLTAAGHPVAMISSAMSREGARNALEQVRNGSARIVYCSPERFASPVFLDALAQRRIDLLAVDEAHCVSEWGHDFRPDYLRLPEIAERLGRPPVMACTATATKAVAAEIVSRFRLKQPLQVRSGFDRPNLSFDVVRLEGKGSKARRLALLEGGLADPENRPAIVYCGTRRDTDEVAQALRDSGLRALAYHAGMESDDRTSTQRRFMEGDAEVIVATNAFGMGVDKADVRSVWHMAIPTSLEAYYQEAGRGGRDGLPAKAVLLAMKADLGRLVRFIEQRDPELTIARERGWRDYRTIKSFIYDDRCRRRSILDHFGDHEAGRPLGRCCDVCDGAGWLPDPETIVVRRTAKPKAPPAEPAEADAPLFEELKAWRLKAAAGKPAYTVAHNKTLAAIAATRPADETSLAEISGVGPSFVAKYADEVLQLVAQ